MGAYLAAPLTDKESTDEANEYLACGASQMQGWRMTQEVSYELHRNQLKITQTTAITLHWACKTIDFAALWTYKNTLSQHVHCWERRRDALRYIASFLHHFFCSIISYHFNCADQYYSVNFRWSLFIFHAIFAFLPALIRVSAHSPFQDAHICELSFDKDKSLFAVFDGHGGSEVALYCSQKLPAFLKAIEAYKKGEYEQALKDAFIGFDATLVSEEVIEELKKLIPDKDNETDTDEEADEDEENLNELCNEGHMPLNELLQKLKDPNFARVKQGESSGSSKPLSPFLRGRRNGSSSSSAATENGECSSASDSTAAPKKLDVSTNSRSYLDRKWDSTTHSAFEPSKLCIVYVVKHCKFTASDDRLSQCFLTFVHVAFRGKFDERKITNRFFLS